MGYFTDINYEKILMIILYTLFFIIVIIVLYMLGKYLMERYLLTSRTDLLMGVKKASKPFIISQTKGNPSYKLIKRSEGQNGLEFSYSMWLYIENLSNNKQHILHKGSVNGYPLMSPAIYIENKKIIIYQNSLTTIKNKLEINKFPLRKWFNLIITVHNKTVSSYINGYLFNMMKMDNLAKQNNGDLFININNGFDGYISDVIYYNKLLNMDDIISIIEYGHSTTNCMGKNIDSPPYLNKSWFS